VHDAPQSSQHHAESLCEKQMFIAYEIGAKSAVDGQRFFGRKFEGISA
jgi:hypothetical protein